MTVPVTGSVRNPAEVLPFLTLSDLHTSVMTLEDRADADVEDASIGVSSHGCLTNFDAGWLPERASAVVRSGIVAGHVKSTFR